MAYSITGKKLEGNFLGVPEQSCKPKDCLTKERISIELDGKTYERTIHERIIWRNQKPSTHVAYFVIIDGIFWEVEKALVIDGIKWELKTFEELWGMGFIPDEGTSGAIRTDANGFLWSAMRVDGFWGCEISEGCCFVADSFGDSLEDSIRAAHAAYGMDYCEEEC